MSTKDSCKFHDTKFQLKKTNSKKLHKTFRFPSEQYCQSERKIFGVGFFFSLLLLIFDWVKSHLGNLDFECLLLLYVNKFSKTLFIFYYYCRRRCSQLALQNNNVFIHTVGLITKACKMRGRLMQNGTWFQFNRLFVLNFNSCASYSNRFFC